MLTGALAIALYGGIAAFAACGLSLALLGLGLPYIACAAIAGACAGLLLYTMGRWKGLVPAPAAIPTPDPAPNPAHDRLEQLEHEMSILRHELRGALSPALMVSDRLLRNEDPLVRRAGDAVVRSVERATALIGKDTARTTGVTPPAG